MPLESGDKNWMELTEYILHLNQGSNLDGKEERPSNFQSCSTWVFIKTAQLGMMWIIIFALGIRILRRGGYLSIITQAASKQI